MTDRETFAARWNRRKLEAKRDDASLPEAVSESLTATDAAPIVDDTPLPSLDDITPEGDIAAFLHKRIPAELQKLALRKAWTSDPVISNFIEMAENQYDWNTPGGCPGFGPLDPSWDIEKLLAQATGALPPEDIALAKVRDESVDTSCGRRSHKLSPSPDENATKSNDASHDEVASDDELPDCSVPCSSSEQMIEQANPAPSYVMPVDMFQESQRLAAHNSASQTRRRHGGALPKT